MEQPKKTGKLRRVTNPALEEANKIAASLTKKLFKNVTTPLSHQEAVANVNDMGTIHDMLVDIITRRNLHFAPPVKQQPNLA